MKTNKSLTCRLPGTKRLLLAPCIFTLCAGIAHAQEASATPPRPAPGALHIVHLQNAPTQGDQNELLTAIRNILPPLDRIFLVPSQNAIVFRGPEEDFADVQKLVAELDHPHKLYRLIFTVRDSDGGKQVGLQHFTLAVAAGQRTQLKGGSRVPIVTGSYGAPVPTPQTQFTYLDVGMNFDATVDEVANGLRLRSKVERSSLAEEKGAFGKDDPIIRQSTIEGTSFLTLNKPLSLGSLDASDSTRRVDIEVTAELIK